MEVAAHDIKLRQFPGDALGYPDAHANDARRAALAARHDARRLL